MRSRAMLFVLPLLSVGWLCGCAPRGQIHEQSADPAAAAVEVVSPGRPINRGRISPDLSELESVESVAAVPVDETEYLALTASDCKCMAADHAETANLIDRERAIARCCGNERRKCKQQSSALQTELLAYRAAAERNRAAGEALELFYLLAEAEAGRDALAKSKTGVEKIREFVTRLRDAGLDAGMADTAVENRWGQVLDREAQLLLDRQKLNSELRRRLGLDVDDPTPIWPDTDLRVEVEEIDVNAAIAEGMMMRPDLAATQRLLECLDRDNLSQARTSLQAFEGVLGSAGAPSRLFKLANRSAESCESGVRCGQMEQLLVHLQRSVAEEIRQAVQTVNIRFRQILIAKQRLSSRERAVENLKRQWGGDDVSPFEIVDAQMKVVEAETDLVHQVVAWEIARVKLKQAQGLFALECGYTEPPGPLPTPIDKRAGVDDVDPDVESMMPPPPVPPSSSDHEPRTEAAGALEEIDGDDEYGDRDFDDDTSELIQPASVSGRSLGNAAFARLLIDDTPTQAPGETADGDDHSQKINLTIPLQMASPPKARSVGLRQPDSVATGVENQP